MCDRVSKNAPSTLTEDDERHAVEPGTNVGEHPEQQAELQTRGSTLPQRNTTKPSLDICDRPTPAV